jgi:hypothetical protein
LGLYGNLALGKNVYLAFSTSFFLTTIFSSSEIKPE